LSLRSLFYSVVLVVVIAIYVLALGKNNIFEVVVQVDEGFGLKVDAIVIEKDRIASLNTHVDEVYKSLFVQAAYAGYPVLGFVGNRECFV
jgi:hypothetical protein